MKKSGPAFRQQKVALARCDECTGRGVVKPMFYEMACVTCHASGIVDKDTGEGLPLADLVLQLRIRLNEKNEETKFRVGDAVVLCPVCQQPHHVDCWLWSDGHCYGGDTPCRGSRRVPRR